MKKMKKLLCLVLVAVLMSGLLLVTANAEGVTATPTRSTITINSQATAMEGYTINGYNYFKLRDIAMALNSSVKHFSVTWDGDANAIWIVTANYYAAVGGELAVTGSTSSVSAVPTASKVYMNGRQIDFTSYTIGGYNYFKLRDIGAAIDFGVKYDEKTDNIIVNTSAGYFVAGILGFMPYANYDPMTGRISYSSSSIGSITVNILSTSYYRITALNTTSSDGLAMLKNIIGVFTIAPETVIDALNTSKTGGKNEIKYDGRTFSCLYLGQTQTVDITW